MYIPSNSSDVGMTLTTPHLFYRDVQYGDTNLEKMDIWIPSGATTLTGVVVNIHGGGFIGGSKNGLYSNSTTIDSFLADGVAYVGVDYDLVNTDRELVGYRTIFNRFKLAIQTLKHNNVFLNIDKAKFILDGGSSGAGLAMWLAYGPERAEPANSNPILRESTAALGVTLVRPQATYDIVKWETQIFAPLGYSLQADVNTNELSRLGLYRVYAIESYTELFTPEIIAYRAELDMLQFIADGGGVETYLNSPDTLHTDIVSNTVIDITHSPYHGQAIKTALDAQGIANVTYIQGLGITDPSGETEGEFIRRLLGVTT